MIRCEVRERLGVLEGKYTEIKKPNPAISAEIAGFGVREGRKRSFRSLRRVYYRY